MCHCAWVKDDILDIHYVQNFSHNRVSFRLALNLILTEVKKDPEPLSLLILLSASTTQLLGLHSLTPITQLSKIHTHRDTLFFMGGVVCLFCVALAFLEFTLQTRLALNFEITSLCLLSTGIKGVHYHHLTFFCIFILCVCVFSYSYVRCVPWPEEGIRSPETRVTIVMSHPI